MLLLFRTKLQNHADKPMSIDYYYVREELLCVTNVVVPNPSYNSAGTCKACNCMRQPYICKPI